MKLLRSLKLKLWGFGGLITISNVDGKGSGGSHSADEREIGGASLVVNYLGMGLIY